MVKGREGMYSKGNAHKYGNTSVCLCGCVHACMHGYV